MNRIAIFGVGGSGRELVEPLMARVASLDDNSTICFADDNPEYIGSDICGLEVVSGKSLTDDDYVIIAIGDGKIRKIVNDRMKRQGVKPYLMTAVSFIQGRDVEIGPGAVFCDYTMVTTNARIGEQFQCNMYSYVAHDCAVGDYVTFAPRVNCNGNVHIGDFAYIGSGAVLKQGTPDKPLRIGAGAVVGMGAVVTKDVPDGAVVMGNPARVKE